MAWTFRKRVKIIPGVHLNFSKKGISTTIGGRGGSITFAKNGTYINQSIPGLGLSNRTFIPNSGSNKNSFQNENSFPAKIREEIIEKGNIFSVDPHEITSQDMQGVKETIMLSKTQRMELSYDLKKIKLSLGLSKTLLIFSKIFIYGLIKKSIPENIEKDITTKREAIHEIKEQIEASYVILETDFDEDIKEKYLDVVKSFKQLSTSNKIWDITNSEYNDRVVTRSAASNTVNRKEVIFSIKSLPDIKSNLDVMFFKNANGADIYLYPGFLLMYSSSKDIGIIGLEELYLEANTTTFVESEKVPSDSRIIGHTWHKVNKNGSRDKRFKGNYQIPMVEYFTLGFRTKTGMNEKYQISNLRFGEQFYQALTSYKISVKS